MINRSYLPFLSAREYQDRGMAKWMGFFLSEHSSSLWDEKNKDDISIGIVKEIRKESISIKTDTGFLRLKWEDILDIQIEGESLDESERII